jgi:hypothetical protein
VPGAVAAALADALLVAALVLEKEGENATAALLVGDSV